MASEPFVCAICEREIEMRWNTHGPDRVVPPVCRYCESHYGSRTKLTAGSFMDRRKAKQIGALAEALSGKAHCMQWSQRHGRA